MQESPLGGTQIVIPTYCLFERGGRILTGNVVSVISLQNKSIFQNQRVCLDLVATLMSNELTTCQRKSDTKDENNDYTFSQNYSQYLTRVS